jgi:hypothetical protein
LAEGTVVLTGTLAFSKQQTEVLAEDLPMEVLLAQELLDKVITGLHLAQMLLAEVEVVLVLLHQALMAEQDY